MGNAKDQNKQGAGNQQQGGGNVQQAVGNAKQAASSVASKAAGVAQGVEEQAENLYHQASDSARQAYDRSAEALSHVRGQAETAVNRIKDYVEDKDFGQMAEEMSNVIRRHPLPAVLIGIGVGFLLARSTRSH